MDADQMTSSRFREKVLMWRRLAGGCFFHRHVRNNLDPNRRGTFVPWWLPSGDWRRLESEKPGP
jgi:hypothetical protein